MINSSRLASIIFDGGRKIQETEYKHICESIENDSLTINSYVLDYKRKDSLLGGVFFQLNDGSRIIMSEEAIEVISNLDLNKENLLEFMSRSKENFQTILCEIINGIE